MPNAESPTLAVVLGLNPEDKAALRARLAAAEDAFREVRAGKGAGVAATLWDAMRDEFDQAIYAACDVPVTTILAEAWKQYKPLRSYCDPASHPPGTVNHVPLAKHRVAATQNPFIDCLLGSKSLFKVELVASLSIGLEGAVVTIEGGRFRVVRPGKSEVEASLAWEETVLVRREIGEYTLPGALSFGNEGIPICPDRRPGVESSVVSSHSSVDALTEPLPEAPTPIAP